MNDLAIMQMGLVGEDRWANDEDGRAAAQAEADRLNREADEEAGEEVWGDGAATVVEVDDED